jgi:hypothetical protein
MAQSEKVLGAMAFVTVTATQVMAAEALHRNSPGAGNFKKETQSCVIQFVNGPLA